MPVTQPDETPPLLEDEDELLRKILADCAVLNTNRPLMII